MQIMLSKLGPKPQSTLTSLTSSPSPHPTQSTSLPPQQPEAQTNIPRNELHQGRPSRRRRPARHISHPYKRIRAGLFGPLGASPFSLPTVKRALAEMEGGLGRCAGALDVAYSRAHRAPRSMKCRRVYLRVRRIIQTTESWGELGCDNRCGFACGCEWEDGAEDVESGGLQTDDANVGRKMGRNAKAKMFASRVPGRI